MTDADQVSNDADPDVATQLVADARDIPAAAAQRVGGGRTRTAAGSREEMSTILCR